MYSEVKTAILRGIDSTIVTIEADVSDGMPCFEMVGFLSSEVKEARERVRTALKNCGFLLPPKKIIINIAPASIKKQGCGFDLPLAISILKATKVISEEDNNTMMIGELGLSGQINSVKGVLPILLDAVDNNINECIVPYENRYEAMLVSGIKIVYVKNLLDVISYLNYGKIPEYSNLINNQNDNNKDKNLEECKYDFSYINGQKMLKRAAEIAASGMHNLLMVGPPGAGKTMMARCIPTILPPMTKEESIVLSKIYSVYGLFDEDKSLITDRPFRNPHHTISPHGLIGGGNPPCPGEISLAHNGVLFLDELTEFKKSVLEMLRQPMEDLEVTISRTSSKITFPSNFMLVCAMNPCSCGYYPDLNRCRCDRNLIKRYLNKLSQPLMDRIDICTEASSIGYKDIVTSTDNESSEEIRKRVINVHNIQRERYLNEQFNYNSEIPSNKIEEYCRLDEKEMEFMEKIYEKYSLTGRTYYKLLKVARTIADMDGKEYVELIHLKEALMFRGLDKKYWDS